MTVEAAAAPVEGAPPVETEPKATETQPAAPPKAEEPPKPKLGEFARKAAAERERVKAANEAKERAAEVERLRAEKADREKADAARRATYLQNPLQALMDAFPGIEPVKAFEMLAEAAKNGGKTPISAEVARLQQEVAETRRNVEESLKAQKEEAQRAAQEAQERAEAQFREEIGTFLESNADEFELTNLYGMTNLVYATIEEHFQQTKKVMPIKEAAKKVEEYLEGEAEKALKTKKLSAKLKPAEPAKEPPKTLSNDLKQGAPAKPAMTEAERMARAAAALEGLL